MVRTELPVATRAFFWACACSAAGISRRGKTRCGRRPCWFRRGPRTGSGLPRPVALLPLRLPPDWATWGHHLAQETRWAAVGKTVMSTPISAMTSWAVMIPVPCTASSWSIWCQYGSVSCSILAVSSLIRAV